MCNTNDLYIGVITYARAYNKLKKVNTKSEFWNLSEGCLKPRKTKKSLITQSYPPPEAIL